MTEPFSDDARSDVPGCSTCLGFGHLENLGLCPDCQPEHENVNERRENT